MNNEQICEKLEEWVNECDANARLLNLTATRDESKCYAERAAFFRLTIERLKEREVESGAGTVTGRLEAIGKFAQEHCGHNTVSAKPPELTLMEQFLECKAMIAARPKEGGR